MVNQHYPYTHAQELNEYASRLVEIGDYDRAISALTKALEMWKACRSTDEEAHNCMCPHCHSEPKEGTCSMEVDEKEIVTTRYPMHQSPTEKVENQQPIGSEYGYIYQEMIQIPCRQTFESCNVGSAVALIIIFNLAIAHHLSSLTTNSKLRMAKTLRLYQLSNDCLNTFVNDTHSCFRKGGGFEMGTLIQMILINNLSHLHSFMGNHSTSLHCTEKLIPILMCVVDDKVRNIESPIFSDVGRISLEGFLRNICPLVLTSQCADAA